MTKRKRVVIGGVGFMVALGLGVRFFDILEDDDVIDLKQNRGGDRAVVLVYGKKNGRCLNENEGIFRGRDLVNLGNMSRNGSCRSDVAVFSLKDSFSLTEDVLIWRDDGGDKLPVQ